MEVRELRIGNYLESKVDYDGWGFAVSKGNYFSIKEFNGNYLHKWSDMGASGSFSLDDAIPIPLTEEWLLKFGFVSNPYQDIYYIKNGDNSFVIDINKTRGKLELFWKHIDLKYVHQLQNLYFALTGEELTIKQ